MSLLWDIVQIGLSLLFMSVVFTIWKLLVASTPWWDNRRQARKDVLMQYRAAKKNGGQP